MIDSIVAKAKGNTTEAVSRDIAKVLLAAWDTRARLHPGGDA